MTTERLILRDIVEADAEDWFALDSDPEVMRYIGTRPTDDIEWYRERIRSIYIPQQSHSWHGIRIVADRATERFLGWVFIRPATGHQFARELGWTRADEVEVGYRYHRDVWGRGIATEAASPLMRLALADPQTAAVVGCARADNCGSLRVLEKLGLQRVDERVLPTIAQPVVTMVLPNPSHLVSVQG